MICLYLRTEEPFNHDSAHYSIICISIQLFIWRGRMPAAPIVVVSYYYSYVGELPWVCQGAFTRDAIAIRVCRWVEHKSLKHVQNMFASCNV